MREKKKKTRTTSVGPSTSTEITLRIYKNILLILIATTTYGIARGYLDFYQQVYFLFILFNYLPFLSDPFLRYSGVSHLSFCIQHYVFNYSENNNCVSYVLILTLSAIIPCIFIFLHNESFMEWTYFFLSNKLGVLFL